MTEQEGKVMKSKQSQLSKYEIPLNHLSFEYVEKCNDRKELEKIVKILRDTECKPMPSRSKEGVVQDPSDSRHGHSTSVMGSGEEGYYPQLTECAESRLKQIDPLNRLLRVEEPDWTNEMKNKEHALQEIKSSAPELPTIRSKWDKFDVNKEILKMELEEERRREQLVKKKKQEERENKKKKNGEENLPITAAKNLSSVEKEIMATKEKERGNEYYKAGDFEEAAKCYSNSIELWPLPVSYNNRAAAQLKLKKFNAVIADCNQVLKADPLNSKALYRRGLAYQSKNCCKQAYVDFTKVLEVEPDNVSARCLADNLKKRVEPEVRKKGFVIPGSPPNVPVNEWGLAKVMCKCTGTPVWVHQKPPKCEICKRKRAERRAKREEEARKAAEMEQETVVTPCDDGDQMQTDEKGSGDMKDTEKMIGTGEECAEFPKIVDNYVLDEQLESGDSKMNNVTNFTTQSINNATYNCNIINSCDNKNEQDESNQKESISDESPKDNVEIDNSKTNVDCEKKVVGSDDAKKPQKSPIGSDSSSGQYTKVKIANKYNKNISVKKNGSPEQEDSEVANITTPFEFMKVWQSLKVSSDLATHAQVLRSVAPSDLLSVIGNKLDGQMLSTMLICLDRHFTPELALEYLNNIIELPRFKIVQMFLEVAEKKVETFECVVLFNFFKIKVVHSYIDIWFIEPRKKN
ncbi:hypothetical protein C0J52_20481 [Blattella germanica]|nr:hypothetical protein C0J52_20481 [Blattella germanica]